MNVALIAPINNLDLSAWFSDYHMVLAWLCLQEDKYRLHYKKLREVSQDAYIILDNGANEKKLIGGLTLMDLAKSIGASEVIAPDVYLNGPETFKQSSEFLNLFWGDCHNNGIKVMVVPQGRDRKDLLDCYVAFLVDHRTDVLGIGYRNLYEAFKGEMETLTPSDWEVQCRVPAHIIHTLKTNLTDETFYYTLSRIYFIKKYVNMLRLSFLGKKLHLLGCYNPFEISLYKMCFTKEELQLIRSIDTAAPFQAAQMGVHYNENFGVVNKPKAYLDFTIPLTDDGVNLSIENIKMMEKWLS